MSSSDGSSSGSSSEGEEQEQHVQQVVTGANADPQVLQYFWDLASLQQEERQAAAEALVAALIDNQKRFDTTHRPPGAQPSGSFDQQDGGNRQQRMEACLSCCSPLMAYGLKRLARGLASSRQGARQGFAAALASTLVHSAAAAAAAHADKSRKGKGTSRSQQPDQQQLQLPFVSAAGVLALLDACLEVTGSMKGSEQRDALLGRVFGLAALTRSGLISAYPAAASTAPEPSSSGSQVSEGTAAVAEQLAGLLQKKSFLRESAAAALVELLQPLDQSQMAAVLQQAPKTAALLQVAPPKASPEALFLALRLWHAVPEQQLQQCPLLPALPAKTQAPSPVFWQQPSAVKRKHVAAAAGAVFASGHVQLMVPALLLSTSSHPRLHPVWGCLLALLVPGFVPIKDQQQPEEQQQQLRAPPDVQQLQSFWKHFVEESCLSSSHERKALALQLLLMLVPVMTAESVPVLLNKQLLGCIATALKDKESYLYASARRCLDRLSQAADHSHVVQGDAAATAKLRLALAAAMQSANLSVPGSKAANKTAKAGPLQGLDAAGVAAYVDQMMQEFVEAVQAAEHKRAGAAAANGVGGSGSESEGEEDQQGADADAGVAESKAPQLLEQLVAGLKLPAADASTVRKGCGFLAAVAFLTLPEGFEPAAVAGGSSGSSKKDKKAKKAKAGKAVKNGQSAAGSAAPLDQPDLQSALQLAASMQPQPSQQLKQLAGARLVGLLHYLQHKPAPAQQPQQQHKGPQQPDSSGGEQQLSAKQRKAAQRAAQEAAAGAARAAAAQATEMLTVQLLDLVAAVDKLPGVAATVEEDIMEMVEQLGQLGAVIAQHAALPPAAAAAPSSNGGSQSQQQLQQQAAIRQRTVLHLVHQLQLQLLSGGLSAEAAGSVVDDLEMSVLKGLGLSEQLLEQLRAADAKAKMLLAGAAGDTGEEEEQAAGSESSDQDEEEEGSSDDADEEGAPAWQDVLLDLLLSLLSNSSSEGGSAGEAAAAVPSVPVREACEAVFKVFAEEMTPQGLADLLRVLSQRASEVLKSTDEDEEEEEGMEVDESDGQGNQSSGSEDEPSSELDEEQQEQLKDLHRKSASATAGGASDSDDGAEDASQQQKNQKQAPVVANGGGKDAGSDSEEGSSEEGLDDEAMLRLDAQLGAAVRASLSRGAGGAKERAAALLALQLRVASLLEEWLKKCSRSPLVLQVALPVIKALLAARSAGGSPALADRIAGVISKQLARARPVFPGSSKAQPSQQQAAGNAAAAVVQKAVEALEADSRKLLYYASRDKDPRVAAAAGQVLLVLLASGAEAGGAAAGVARASAAAALNDFFEHKKSRLNMKWCQELLSRCFEAVVDASGASQGLTALLTACSKGRNEATRAKAVQLLPALLSGRQPQQVAVLLSVLQQQQGLLAAALGAAVSGPYKGKDQHATAVKAIVQLLGSMIKQGQGKRLAELIGSEAVRELGKTVVVVKAAGVTPRVETQLDRLVEVAGLQQLVAAGKPDPARLTLLKKARAAVEGGPQAPPAAAGSGETASKDQKQSKKDKQHKKDKQQQQGKQKQKRKAEDGEDEKPAATAAGDGSSKQKKQKHAADAPKPERQQHQEEKQQRHKKQKPPAAVPAADQAVAGAAAAAAGGSPSSKRKHDAQGKIKSIKKHKQ